MINKPLRLMEFLWLFLSAVLMGLFLYDTFKSGFKSSYSFLILSIISFLMYLLRKNLREKEEEEDF